MCYGHIFSIVWYIVLAKILVCLKGACSKDKSEYEDDPLIERLTKNDDDALEEAYPMLNFTTVLQTSLLT